MEIVLPADIVAATHFAADADHEVVRPPIPGRPRGDGHRPGHPRPVRRQLADAKTVFWNGPMGVFEFPAFAAGTLALAQAISACQG